MFLWRQLILFFGILVTTMLVAGNWLINEESRQNSETVETILKDYDGYDAVVSGGKYADDYTIHVEEYDNYKTVTMHFKNNGKEIVFDLLPDFSYHLKDPSR